MVFDACLKSGVRVKIWFSRYGGQMGGGSKSSSSINLPKADMRHENLVLMGSNGVKMEFFSISTCKWEVNCALLLVKTACMGNT